MTRLRGKIFFLGEEHLPLQCARLSRLSRTPKTEPVTGQFLRITWICAEQSTGNERTTMNHLDLRFLQKRNDDSKIASRTGNPRIEQRDANLKINIRNKSNARSSSVTACLWLSTTVKLMESKKLKKKKKLAWLTATGQICSGTYIRGTSLEQNSNLRHHSKVLLACSKILAVLF